MRFLIRRTMAILFFVFVCKIALQAQAYSEPSEAPKSFLLISIAPERPIPSARIDATKIIAAIRNDRTFK